jgi:hypothetical protein
MKKGPKRNIREISKTDLKVYEKLELDTRNMKWKCSNLTILKKLLEKSGLTPSEIESVTFPHYIPGHLVDLESIDYDAYLDFMMGVVKTPSGSILAADCLWGALYYRESDSDFHIPIIGELEDLPINNLIQKIKDTGWDDTPDAPAALEVAVSFVLLIQLIKTRVATGEPWPWWPPNQP